MESKTEQHIANWGVVWKSQIKPPREHKGPFPPLSFCVLALSVRRNAAVALPCRKRLRTQKTVFFSPPFPLVESRHFPYSVVGIRPQPVNQIWFLGFFFWKAGSRVSNIIGKWAKNHLSLGHQERNAERPPWRGYTCVQGHRRHHLRCSNWLGKWRDVSEFR